MIATLELTHDEILREEERTKKPRREIIREHRLRNLPESELSPIERKWKVEDRKEQQRQAEREEKRRTEDALQQAYQSRLSAIDSAAAEIGRGESSLAFIKGDQAKVVQLLEDWPSTTRGRPEGYLNSVYAQHERNQWWLTFLPAWLERRRAALAEMVKQAEQFAKENGIKTK